MIEKDLRQMISSPFTALDGDEGGEIEIEIVDDSENPGALEEMLPVLAAMGGDDGAEPFEANLAEYLDESYMLQLAGDLVQDYEDDLNSRREWEDTLTEGMKLLGLKRQDRMEPWPGACNVTHPLLLEGVVRFQAEMTTETLPAAGPVKAQILGKITPEKERASERVCADMNYHITRKMPEFRNEQERLYWSLPITGSAFKKIYHDPSLGRATSVFIPADDFVVAYGTTDLSTCPRATHRMRKTHNDVKRLQASGFYRDVPISEPARITDRLQEARDEQEGYSALYDDRHELLEMAVDLVLQDYEEDEDIAVPYIVTIDKQSQTILSIRRNWDENDPHRNKRQHFVHYQYVPGFGFYGFGLIHIVGGFSESATSIIRQLVDAGTLSNLPGGFKTRGMRVIGDDTPISPGEFRDVDIPSGTLKDNVMPLPYKEPSSVLYQLLATVVDEGRRMSSLMDLKLADMSGQTPVGTTLAIMERTLKIMSAVQSRVYYALDGELKLLGELIRDNGDDKYPFEVDDPNANRLDDYAMVDILPVSNPNASTMAQRVMQYQAVIQLAQQSPQIYDMANLHRRMLDAMGIDNIDTLIPSSKESKPMDPVSENMNLIKGGKAKAFMVQDHLAHMTVHVDLLNDPKMAQAFQNMPNGQAIQAAINAHIMEHAAFQYRNEMEQTMGVELPPPEAPLPPDIETKLSRLLAQAADQLLMKNQQEAQMQQIQQQMQDPMIMLQQQEVAIKAKEVENKVIIEEMKLQSQERIAALNASVKGNIGAAQVANQLMDAELKMQNQQHQHEMAQQQATQAMLQTNQQLVSEPEANAAPAASGAAGAAP